MKTTKGMRRYQLFMKISLQITPNNAKTIQINAISAKTFKK